jgi:hypothetical protein
MVLETLFEHIFIAAVPLESTETPPLVRIFKSGLIAVTQPSAVLLFDQRGIAQKRIPLPSLALRIEKYYDLGSRKFLLVLMTGSAIVVDLITCQIVRQWAVEANAICGIKRSRSFLVGRRHPPGIAVIDFRSLFRISFRVREHSLTKQAPMG